ncbi:hypothetical protein [Altererythrobacter sp. ZODW24]|nr:hypothetical protein [Altererythrobacter sp. ZODW24]
MPTILFFHGNGARWQDAETVAYLAMERGYGVMGSEYRGYQENGR